MSFAKLLGLIKKDIKLFLVDRQAVVLSLFVPILIASILGWLDSSAAGDTKMKAIQTDLVDLDHSTISQSVVTRINQGQDVALKAVSEEIARKDVMEGETVAALVIPSGFGKQTENLTQSVTKPTLQLLTDPSHPLETQIVKGTVLEDSSAVIAQSSFGSLFGDGSAPIEVKSTSLASNPQSQKWAAAAHDYAGFGLQGLLFFAMEAAVGLVREKRLGVWPRFKAAPISMNFVLLSREISSSLVALLIIFAICLFGAILFGIRVTGSALGFASVALTTAIMAATFGLLMATVGKTEAQSRGMSFLLIMVMLATGGAWFPLEKMPPFVQQLANWLPVNWAISGFDATTWRGLGFSDVTKTIAALLGFSVFFGTLAVIRFKTANLRE